jgi:hypothetical protein
MDPSLISCKNLGEEVLSLSVKTYQQLKEMAFLSVLYSNIRLRGTHLYAHPRVSRS